MCAPVFWSRSVVRETVKDTERGSIGDTERDREDASRYGAGRQEGCGCGVGLPSDQGTLRCVRT